MRPPTDRRSSSGARLQTSHPRQDVRRTVHDGLTASGSITALNRRIISAINLRADWDTRGVTERAFAVESATVEQHAVALSLCATDTFLVALRRSLLSLFSFGSYLWPLYY